MKTIFAIFSHPDDCELWAGGILKKQIEAGDTVRVYFFHQLTEERMEESKQALQILGMTPIFLPTESYQSPGFENFISQTRGEIPDIVISHWEDDTHLEHRIIFEHTLKYVHYIKRYNKRTPLFLMSSGYFQVGRQQQFNPALIFDITPYIEHKKAAIHCHKSQKPTFLLKDILAQNSLTGNQVGVEYAEGFIEYPLFGFRRTALRTDLTSLI